MTRIYCDFCGDTINQFDENRETLQFAGSGDPPLDCCGKCAQILWEFLREKNLRQRGERPAAELWFGKEPALYAELLMAAGAVVACDWGTSCTEDYHFYRIGNMDRLRKAVAQLTGTGSKETPGTPEKTEGGN